MAGWLINTTPLKRLTALIVGSVECLWLMTPCSQNTKRYYYGVPDLWSLNNSSFAQIKRSEKLRQNMWINMWSMLCYNTWNMWSSQNTDHILPLHAIILIARYRPMRPTPWPYGFLKTRHTIEMNERHDTPFTSLLVDPTDEKKRVYR